MNSPWAVHIITIFPDIFPGPLQYSIAGKASELNLWKLTISDLRKFADNKHMQVDDTSYGGGSGLVFKPDILQRAIDNALSKEIFDEIIYFSPRGQLFNQEMAKDFSQKKLLMICGRYEGIDQRVIDHYKMKEVSIGDYILSGGEIAALTVLDSCIRMIPNVIKNSNVHLEESFSNVGDSNYLLEYPHYTKPSTWNNIPVPDILLSGNHKKIKEWRIEQSEKITRKNRKDLWRKYKKSKIKN